MNNTHFATIVFRLTRITLGLYLIYIPDFFFFYAHIINACPLWSFLSLFCTIVNLYSHTTLQYSLQSLIYSHTFLALYCIRATNQLTGDGICMYHLYAITSPPQRILPYINISAEFGKISQLPICWTSSKEIGLKTLSLSLMGFKRWMLWYIESSIVESTSHRWVVNYTDGYVDFWCWLDIRFLLETTLQRRPSTSPWL